MKEEAAAAAATLDEYDKNHKLLSKVKAGWETILFEQDRLQTYSSMAFQLSFPQIFVSLHLAWTNFF